MKQLAINYATRPLSRRDDPASSMRAAERGTKDGTFQKHEAMIVEAIRAHPGRDVHGLAKVVPLLAHQIGKRLAKIEEKGLAYPVDTGGRLRLWFPREGV